MKNIIDEARLSIGKFCYEECMAYCCRKGRLDVTKEEIQLIAGNSFNKLLEEGRIYKKNENEGYTINLNKGCPALSESKCTIHNEPKRPAICRDFPIFVKGKTVQINQRCYAAMKGYFYPFISRLEKEGFFLEGYGQL
ncbi:MAG: YkgJ family cysteine cluster protein [Candidatus Nanoarchaeia archaeon]